MEEFLEANLTANQLSERVDNGKLRMPICLVGDNDGCFKCATNGNPKSELFQKQCMRELIWCDNRDMVADPLTK
eukprot:11140053-Prorocentrum_lima.AAC.1